MENEIITTLQKYESDHFLISAFAPKENQESIIALLYLHHELSKIEVTVTEPMMAKIRYQWWWDFVVSFYEEPKVAQNHPITPFFKELTNKVSMQKLHALIEAHEKSVEEEDFFQVVYALFVVLMALDDTPINSMLSQAYYLVFSLVNMAQDLKKGRVIFDDMSPEDDDFTAKVQIKYEQALELVNQVSFSQKTYLSLYKDLLKAYLKELKKAQFHPFDTRLQKRPNFIELKLFLKSIINRF